MTDMHIQHLSSNHQNKLAKQDNGSNILLWMQVSWCYKLVVERNSNEFIVGRN